VIYDDIRELRVDGSDGRNINDQINNFQASMTVNFDEATVTDGKLSFNDNDGLWSADFDGLISVERFEMNLNQASHGDQPAGGNIDALFLNGLDDILTTFDLFEINNEALRVRGNFILR
jgi:hypothetical protein